MTANFANLGARVRTSNGDVGQITIAVLIRAAVAIALSFLIPGSGFGEMSRRRGAGLLSLGRADG